MKLETKCEYCGLKSDEPCDFANYITEIEGKTYTFCCQTCASKYKTERTKEK